MPSVDDLDQVLSTSTLTVGELILAAVIVVLTAIVARWSRRRIRDLLKATGADSRPIWDLISRAAGWLVWLIGIVAALVVVGVDVGPVVLILVIVLAVTAFAAQDMIENFAAGLVLQLQHPFDIGDRIETNEIVGIVTAINSRATVVLSRDGQTIHVPNRLVMKDVLYNYTDTPLRLSEVAFTVTYGSDLAEVERLALNAVRDLSEVASQPAPEVYISSLADSGIVFQVAFSHADSERFRARHSVGRALVEAVAASENADMAFPHVVVLDGEENET